MSSTSPPADPADDSTVDIDVTHLKRVYNLDKNKEYYIVTTDLTTRVTSKPKKLTFLSLKSLDLFNNSEDTYTFNNGITYTNTINYTNKENDTGTRVEFYEIPPVAGKGGKRGNNRRKSAKTGGRSRRMRRMRRSNNRKSSLRF